MEAACHWAQGMMEYPLHPEGWCWKTYLHQESSIWRLTLLQLKKFSLVLLAAVNANYKLFVDVGAVGSESD